MYLCLLPSVLFASSRIMVKIAFQCYFKNHIQFQIRHDRYLISRGEISGELACQLNFGLLVFLRSIEITVWLVEHGLCS